MITLNYLLLSFMNQTCSKDILVFQLPSVVCWKIGVAWIGRKQRSTYWIVRFVYITAWISDHYELWSCFPGDYVLHRVVNFPCYWYPDIDTYAQWWFHFSHMMEASVWTLVQNLMVSSIKHMKIFIYAVKMWLSTLLFW